MFRTTVFWCLGLIAIGSMVAPGFALLGLLLLLSLFGVLIWWMVLAVATRAHPSEALVHTTHRHRLLGPGGPDDPLSDLPYDD